MSTILERDKVEETTIVADLEPGDHDRFRHAFNNKAVADAVFTGKPAVALCGKKDIPMREAAKFPVCPTCKELYEALPNK